MRKRVTSDSGNTVSLFPFLAVLLCTMGALLVLLVVLAQRAGERALASVESAPQEQSTATVEPVQVASSDTEETDKLAKRLDEVRTYLEKLAKLRQQVDERLRAEQDKLTHLEEHTRRLEHELARLSVAAEQLKAAEEDQAVDQEQAERELTRIRSLIEDKEKQVAKLQEETKGKRSYAIVPFQDKEGTTVQRIYIECRGDGVVVQPEGIVFDGDDFFAADWSGNPLAQVVRATQQHLQANARAAGRPDGFVPLPLLIVRPDGIIQHSAARKALEAAKIGFGLDFVGGKHELTYPVPFDPILAKKQNHARMNARQALIQHIASAPRQYRKKLEAFAVRSGGIGVGSSQAKAALFDRLRQSGDSPSDGEGGESLAGGSSQDGDSTWGDSQLGNLGAEKEINQAAEGMASGDSLAANGNTDQGEQIQLGGLSAPAESSSNQISGGAPAAGSAGVQGGSAEGEMAAGNTAQNAASGQQGASGNQLELSDERASKETVANLGGKRSRNSVPIQRPIQVVVRRDQFAVLPSRHVSNASQTQEGTVISMNQSVKQIGAELVVALREHMNDWGIAGRGLYWKPVLNLKVGPDGEATALRLAQLLSKSGIETRLPEHVQLSKGGRSNAPR